MKVVRVAVAADLDEATAAAWAVVASRINHRTPLTPRLGDSSVIFIGVHIPAGRFVLDGTVACQVMTDGLNLLDDLIGDGVAD
jgi:hypothetical protein